MSDPAQTQLKVLFIEDTEVDVELALLALEQDGFDVSWTRVEDAPGLRDALAEVEAQIVLSDFSMPRFDGMTALRMVREVSADLPFIFVSGTIGEERAIESIRSGATDYILKTNMRRLGVAVSRALEDAEAKRNAHSAERARARLASILEATSDFVSICDPDGNLSFVNSAGRKLVGLPATGGSLGSAFAYHPKWAAEMIRKDAWPAASASGIWHGETALVGADGVEIPVSHVVIAHRDPEGRLDHYASIARDIRDRKRYEERIAFLANHDALTSLANRELLEDRVGQAIAYLRRSGRPLAVMVVDIDRFKLINDGYGQEAGDELLRLVGDRLTSVTNQSDTVARLGSDSFAVLIADLAHPDDILAIVRRIQATIEEPFKLGTKTAHLSVSIGASVFPRDGKDYATLLRNADASMHRAKAGGQGGFQFYESGMTEAVSERIELEHDLRNALAEDQIELHYQPLVSVADRRIVGVEALMRWKHPQRSWISPAVFIPIAEHSGQILELGEWALREACGQLKAWSSEIRGLRMSVNVSAGQFLHANFSEIVERVLRDSGLQQGQLVLELTESVLVANLESVAEILTRLQSVGVQVAIDDFGTGYSSLSYLSRLPINCLKIDRSFVQRYAKDKYDAEIVRAVISLGRTLGMKVLAEGVESADQLTFLAEHECHEAQGFYFSKPLPAADLSEAIARNVQWPIR